MADVTHVNFRKATTREWPPIRGTYAPPWQEEDERLPLGQCVLVWISGVLAGWLLAAAVGWGLAQLAEWLA